jgi:5-formyltetrahydrofolate cyclo-ligase
MCKRPPNPPSSPSKAEIRETLQKRLRALLRETFTREGREAAARLWAHPRWFEYTTVLLFLSMETEIDTRFLLELALIDKKQVFLPKIEGENIRFYRVSSASGPWQEGPFRIREPENTDPALALKNTDFPALILAPGLGFDSRGNRLGRGKGYYDRFFASLDSAEKGGQPLPYCTVGFCLETQIIPLVPVESQDKRMDAVLTGSSLIWYTKRDKGGLSV